MASPPILNWSCDCGSIKAKVLAPPVLNFDCHCHSCVAAARHIADTYTSKPSSTPLLSPTTGGTAVSICAGRNVEFVSSLKDETTGELKIKFVKVGETGKATRFYTTCCGTQVSNFLTPGLIAFNRNGLKNEDGSKFVPPGDVLNTMAKYAFNPDTVPEPKHARAPLSIFAKFLPLLIFGSGLKAKYPELFGAEKEAEVVPITW
jgi:hypothetical protein